MSFLSLSLILLHFFAVSAVVSSPPPPPPGYELIDELSDEFDGTTLDPSKWMDKSPGWPGRAPGLFDAANVIVSNGSLQLWARAAKRNDSWPAGFDNYTTSAVHSIATQHQGYFTIRWRTASSGISSSWWFHDNSNGSWTEIDVFESTGVTNPAKNGANASLLVSHTHIFTLPNVSTPELPAKCACTERPVGSSPCSNQAIFALPGGEAIDAAWHTASVNWTDVSVQIYLDGALVNTLASTCLGQAIGMDFDRETMPGWMSLPDPATLPDRPFEVDYVRSYRRVI